MNEILTSMNDNWVFWVVSIFAVVAAYIDGKELRVPNKLTFPMIVAGWVFCTVNAATTGEGWYVGLGYSLLGTAAGLATLLPAYAIRIMVGCNNRILLVLRWSNRRWHHCFHHDCVSWRLYEALLPILHDLERVPNRSRS